MTLADTKGVTIRRRFACPCGHQTPMQAKAVQVSCKCGLEWVKGEDGEWAIVPDSRIANPP